MVCGKMHISLFLYRAKLSLLEMENRLYWSVEDTKALLSIWAEERVQRQFDGVCRNEDVIKYIVAELAKLSISRTTLQVREKIKKLRAQYKAIKTHNGKSGAQRRNFPWFDLMDGVLGHRPSVSGETSRDTMAATAESSSQSVLFDSEVEQGPSTLPLLTSTPERHDDPEDLTIIRGGSHHIPQRTRPESRKRKAVNLASREFLQCMQDITQQQMKEERELRREEMKKEMMMRREELDYDAQLRREEMSQRQKESESFASVFSHLTAALLQRK
ncbi:uncharacterized protein LOC143749576 [Siphateles boraxobius]|uniref:uncharacterized protein LOC143703941 n=1 Tax=Siphateles boraxobius TaxID=180520 RepID=UPI0040643B9D